MTTDPLTAAERVEVHLLGYPLSLGARANEHYEEVYREFALLAAEKPDDPGTVPARVLALVDVMGRRYPRQQQHEIEREQAIRRGETRRDMMVHVSAAAGEAGRVLDRMLDEADDFCRDGSLLTLAPSEDIVDFRKWYVAECVAQLAGRPPTPWPGDLR